MKISACIGAFTLAAMVACGGSGSGDDGATAGANALSAPPSASATPAPTSSPTIASCNGKKTCVDAVVLRILFASDLQVNPEANVEPPAPAREIVAEWLAKPNDGRITIGVQPGATASQSKVDVTLMAGHETQTDEGDIEALDLKFTIDGGAIVESSITGFFAG